MEITYYVYSGFQRHSFDYSKVYRLSEIPPEMAESALKVFPMRLTPGMELRTSLQDFVREKGLKAPFVMTCCGSVTKITLRFAQKPDGGINDIKTFNEHFEITSLVGTFSSELLEGCECHLHITLGRADGSTLSGHLVGDAIIFTTAEVVLGECTDAVFTREFDEATGFDELVVKPRKD
ncbi:bifunctional protein GlmU-like isoform X1 [Tigriopus californicus]|uniref:bifunctional protein GlmU-like isoform X1 n=1 Tax=Tigriopus californicus TaxID=6832 RepID=UPI0027DA3A77|nr:bifunctional protein GlmU-like isoform X1 [Tigriopus californicus]XP_059094895.1 bifunctional protein GlmU-like isoform X1 [Tigriopus californicus]